MKLPIDLKMLQSGDAFHDMCFRLVKDEYQFFSSAALIRQWDGGRDILCISKEGADIVFQCKFTVGKLSALKPKILESLRTLDKGTEIEKWILCVSVEVTGDFTDWLRVKMAEFPFIKNHQIWDSNVLVEKLERRRHILEMFFYPIWKQLELVFQTEELEIIRYEPDPKCDWKQRDNRVRRLAQVGNVENGDLVLDVIIRNRGSLQVLVDSIEFELRDVTRLMHGLPGEGLLFPKLEHVVSLRFGSEFRELMRLETPLIVDQKSHQRFMIRCTDTGYGWAGFLLTRITYGVDKVLEMPSWYLYT